MLDWRQVHFDNASAPASKIAGGGGDAPAWTGNAVDPALSREIRRHDPWVEQSMAGQDTGGVLVVATYDDGRRGAMTGPRIDGMEIVEGTYEHPRHAYYRWRYRPRVSGVAGEASYRFFWVTRPGHW